jgi:FkbM family methyltransferase
MRVSAASDHLRAVRDYLGAAAQLSRLGATPGARVRIAVVTCAMPLKRLAPRWGRRWTRLDLRYGGRRVAWHVSDGTELLALADVLCHAQYRMDGLPAPRAIVDLGSNIGASVLYFACCYPGARIVAVEPDPETFRKLQANVASLEGVQARRLAVGARDGEVVFFPSPRSWESSLHPTPLSGEAITVRQVTLDTLLDEAGLDHVELVKLDVEGAEYDVLSACAGLPTRVDALIGELHPGHADVYRATRRLLDKLPGFDVEYVRDRHDELFRAVRRP